MISSIAITAVLASAVAAFTPPGTVPATSNNLTVAFGSVSAVNGVVLPRDSTLSAPSLTAPSYLPGTYTLLMVDLDIPPANSSVGTTQRLHWLQAGFTSARTAPFVLSSNTTPIAAYQPPNPPARAPFSHRYVEYLLNTTDASTIAFLTSIGGGDRANFNTTNAVSRGATLVAANWFNVTNASFLNGTVTASTTLPAGTVPTGTGTPAATSSTVRAAGVKVGAEGALAGVVAAAAFALL